MKTYFRITKLAQKVVSILSPKQKGEKIYLTLLAKLKQTTKGHPYKIIKRAFFRLHPGLKALPYVTSGKIIYVPTYMNYNNVTRFALNCLRDGANDRPKKINFIERLKIEFLTTLNVNSNNSALSFSKEFTDFIVSCRFSQKQNFKRYFSKKRYTRQRAYILFLIKKKLVRRKIKNIRKTLTIREQKRKIRNFRKKILRIKNKNKLRRKYKSRKYRYSKEQRKSLGRKIKRTRRNYLNPYIVRRKRLKKRLKNYSEKYREKFLSKHLIRHVFSENRIRLKRLVKKNIKINTLLREKIKIKKLLRKNIRVEKRVLKRLKTNIVLRKKFLKILTKKIKIQIFNLNNLLIETLKDNMLLRQQFIKVLKTNNHLDNFGFSKAFQKVLVENNKKKYKLQDFGLKPLLDQNPGLNTLLREKIKIRNYVLKRLLLGKKKNKFSKDKWLFNNSLRKFTKRRTKNLLKKFTKRRTKNLLKKFSERKSKNLFKSFRKKKLKPKVFIIKRHKPNKWDFYQKSQELEKFNERLNFKHFISRYSLEEDFNKKHTDRYRYLIIRYYNNKYYNTSKNN